MSWKKFTNWLKKAAHKIWHTIKHVTGSVVHTASHLGKEVTHEAAKIGNGIVHAGGSILSHVEKDALHITDKLFSPMTMIVIAGVAIAFIMLK